jgi:transcriptional regulator with PAS, ATPase and Fis domain
MNSELIFGNSRPFKQMVQQCDRYAKSHWPVLITGETGVGKELLAKRLHLQSSRARAPFIPVNCGALPPGLFESELFGYERGAFSGAVNSHRGLVRSAHGGTLFLDEIGDLELNLQVKLLRLLESSEVRSVGSLRFETVDVRIVAATNKDLSQLVQEGSFRQDLLERLSVLPLEVPSLRDRREDILLLAASFLDRLGSHFNQTELQCLTSFEWPGNARQLRNLIIRAHILGEGTITPSLLHSLLRKEKFNSQTVQLAETKLEGVTLADIEKQIIIDRLKRCHGNRKKAAKELGIAKSTLHEKLRKWKLENSEEAWPLYREPHTALVAQ